MTREIIERCLFALVNEGARILAEGIAEREGDVDVVWTLGYGFPTGAWAGRCTGRGARSDWTGSLGRSAIASATADPELTPSSGLVELAG